jgi:hypothetical protein
MVMKLFILVECLDEIEFYNVGIYPSWDSAAAAKLEFLEFEDADTQYYIEE